MTPPLCCGHRGTGKTVPGNPYPENTLVSIQRAVDEGAQMCEFDVLLSADGVPVLMHDDTVDRTTDGTGCVSAMDLEALRGLDVGVGSEMTGVRIDTLAEVLAAVQIPLNVEIKVAYAPCPVQDRGEYAQAVLSVLRADPTPGRRLLVSSFDRELLRVMHAADPSVELAWLWEPGPSRTENGPAEDPMRMLEVAKADGFVAVHPHHHDVTEALMARARELGLEVNTWTVNDPARMAELIPMGLGAIITDEPEKLAALLEG